MAKITLIVSSLRSSLYRTLFLAGQLRDAGHDLLFFAPEDVAQIITENGFQNRLLAEPWINPFSSPLPRPSLKERFSLSARRKRAAQALTHHNVEGFDTMLREAGADLVLINAELHAHIIIARASGAKVGLLASICITAPRLNSPPLHSAQVPGQGLAGSRYAVAATWFHYLARKRLIFMRNALRDWGGDLVSVLSHLARREGIALPTIRRINSWQMPWVYRLPTLLMLPEALDFPKKHWPQSRFVGGRTTVSKGDSDFDISDFVGSEIAGKEGQEKRILVSFGTLARPNNTVMVHLFEAVRNHPEWRVLFVVRERHWDKLPPTPQNMQLVDWAPLSDLIPQMDVVVNHAGNATVLESIDAAVPMLVYPSGNDQFGGAARLAYHNLGLMGARSDNADLISAHIETLLEDPSIRVSLKEMQQACRSEIEARAVVQAVDDLLNDRWDAP